ncbi:hypothetical protein COOONC_03706 [Cooperia oncophora]
MLSEQKKGSCLVARAVPPVLASSMDRDLSDIMEKLTLGESTAQRKADKVANNVSPSDFVSLQSIRSSALAHKTATTSKFCGNGPSLFNDLINKDEGTLNGEVDLELEEKARGDKSCIENDQRKNGLEKMRNSDLLSRGPVKNVRLPQNHHPYSMSKIFTRKKRCKIYDILNS